MSQSDHRDVIGYNFFQAIFDSYFIAEYGYEMSFAIVAISIVCNITLIYRIKFGRMNVTKITLWPYRRALWFLSFDLIECSYYLIMVNLVHTGEEFFKLFW